VTTAIVPSSGGALTRGQIVGSRLYPAINTPDKAAVAVAMAESYGLHPTAILNGLYFVSGKPALSAQVVATLVKRSGKYDFRVREKTDKVCKIEFFEMLDGKRDSLGVETFSMEMAARAGLATGPNWKKYPEALLWARCLTAGVRARCPDVMGGQPCYSAEELDPEAPIDAEGRPVIDAEVTAPSPPANDDPKARAELAEAVDLLITEVGADRAAVYRFLDVSALDEAGAADREKVRKLLLAKKN
jgi:hypothetical protein